MRVIRQLWGRQIIRFVVVGGLNTVIDISLLLLFIKLFGWHEVFANTLSVFTAVSVSYVLNHRLVFRYGSQYSWANYMRFLLVTGLGIVVVQDVVIYIVTKHIWVIDNSAHIVIRGQQVSTQTVELIIAKLSAVVISMTWNFLMYKYVVFRYQDTDDEVIVA